MPDLEATGDPFDPVTMLRRLRSAEEEIVHYGHALSELVSGLVPPDEAARSTVAKRLMAAAARRRFYLERLSLMGWNGDDPPTFSPPAEAAAARAGRTSAQP